MVDQNNDVVQNSILQERVSELEEIGALDPAIAQKVRDKAAARESEAEDQIAEDIVATEAEQLQAPPTDLAAPISVSGEPPLTPEQLAQLPQAEPEIVTPAEVPPVTEEVPQEFVEPEALTRQSAARRTAAAVEKADVERAKSQATLEARQKIQDELITRQEETQKELEKINIEADKAAQEFQDLITEMRSADEDTQKSTFENMSTGRKIGAFIAIALGGLAAGVTGGPNQALQAFNQSVQNDIARQRLAQAGKVTQAKLQQNLLQQLRDKFKSTKAGDSAFKAVMADRLKQQMQIIADKFKGTEVEIKMQNAIGKIEQEQAKALSDLIEERQKRELERGTVRLKVGESLPENFESFDLPRAQRELLTISAPSVGIPKGFLVDNKEKLKIFNDVVKVNEPAHAQLKDILDFSEKHRAAILVPTSKERSELESKLNNAIGALRVILTGPGVLSDTDIKIIKQVIGDPSAYFSLFRNQRAKLQSVLSGMRRNINVAANQVGRKGGESIKSFKPEQK